MSKSETVMHIGDCRRVLKTLPANSIHCCVTSPPYYGLRDYGTGTWKGGDSKCDHIEQPYKQKKLEVMPKGGYFAQVEKGYRFICGKCGAKRIDSQIGLEKTVQEYVKELVAVFEEVRRVLRDDGTLWLNLGDSYAGSGKGGNPIEGKQATNKGSQTVGVLYGKGVDRQREADMANVTRNVNGLEGKQLMGVPWRVAFALQEAGWILRQDIIWHKPNPMPESVTDRCTKAHEYVFLFSKNPKYYFDAKAIAEPAVKAGIKLHGNGTGAKARADGRMSNEGLRNSTCANERNKRSVWTVSTKPYQEAHFATFPRDLIVPMIEAGCPQGGMVLDPFGGSGTVGETANLLGRNAVLIELNPKYAKGISNKRMKQASGFMVGKMRIIDHAKV